MDKKCRSKTLKNSARKRANSMVSFVKALRSEQAAFLDTNPLANHVINVIARRARRTPDPLNGLQIGECFVGHKGLGLSEQQYRTVKKNLQKWGLVEFKKAERVTDRGTVAKLLNSDIYDINEDDPNGRPTEDQRKTNGRVTEDQRQTKNVIMEEGKNGKKKTTRVPLDFSAWPQLPSDNILADYKKLRAAKRATLTQTVVNSMGKQLSELSAEGVSVDQAITICCERGWTGMKAEWVLNHMKGNTNGSYQQPVRQGTAAIDWDSTDW